MFGIIPSMPFKIRKGNDRMKLKYTFDMVDMGEEIIAVPVGENANQIHGVVRLNKSGKEIMELLKNEISEESIIDDLLQKYENEADYIRNHVHSFLQTLREFGVIEE